MAASAPRVLRRTVLAAAALAVLAGPAPAQLLPWEVTVAEIEAGRLRNLVQRLSKQNLLYQLHLGDVEKAQLVTTSREIDRLIESLDKGTPSQSIPAAWTPELRAQIRVIDAEWGALRRIAVASPYDTLRVSREFLPAAVRRGDPLLVRYFDNLSLDLVAQSELLLDLYHQECLKTGSEVCATARTSGYAAMLIERAAKEAVCIVASIDAPANRRRLANTIEAYHELRRANNESPFFANALDPERGQSARAAGQLLLSIREDWDTMQGEFTILASGDEENFDVRRLLDVQSRMVVKVERLTAALVRYASVTYGT